MADSGLVDPQGAPVEASLHPALGTSYKIEATFLAAKQVGLVKFAIAFSETHVRQILDQVKLTLAEMPDDMSEEDSDAMMLDTIRRVCTHTDYLTPSQSRMIGASLISTAEKSVCEAISLQMLMTLGNFPLKQALGALGQVSRAVRMEQVAYERHAAHEQASAQAQVAQQEAEAMGEGRDDPPGSVDDREDDELTDSDPTRVVER